MSSRDYKIELINSYRKLVEVTLKAVSKNEDVQKQVQEEFKMFVEARLGDLMGDGIVAEDKLTSDEIYILKALVSNASKKAPETKVNSTLNKSERTTVVKEDKSPPAYQPKNLQPALGNRKTDKETKNANQDILSRLDEMDKKFENEW